MLIKEMIDNEIGFFFISMISALILGVIQAILYTIKNKYTKSFITTLILTPVAVSLVISLINGNLGLGVAVAGAFSLIRFRSAPGTGKEITAIFISMVTGLAVGAGYIEYASIFLIVTSSIMLILNITNLFNPNRLGNNKILKIAIPEDLNYTTIFNDLFEKYTNYVKKIRVKTTSMGSVFLITYEVVLKENSLEKNFIDELRCRNGNLEIAIFDNETEGDVL